MKYKIFCVYDSVNEEFSLPFYQKNVEVLKRSLKEVLSKSPTLPSEYMIYELGLFDTEAGHMESYPSGVFVCKGSDIVPDPQPELFKEES